MARLKELHQFVVEAGQARENAKYGRGEGEGPAFKKLLDRLNVWLTKEYFDG